MQSFLNKSNNTQCDNFHNELYLQKQYGLFCDVILIAIDDETDPRRIPGHRNILSASSGYFKTMFTTNMCEKDAMEVKMRYVGGRTLLRLVDFCYTRQIAIDADKVAEILEAAPMFDLAYVVKLCEIYYAGRVDITNAFTYSSIAEKYKLNELLEMSLGVIHEKFMEMVQHPTFSQLNADDLAKYLRSDNLVVKSEQDVFNAAMNWIDGADGRVQYFPMLMKTLRVSKIDWQFLTGRIRVCSQALEMGIEYLNVCERKNIQERNPTEVDRKPMNEALFVIGRLGNSFRIQILQYSPFLNTWETLNIDAIEALSVHIHSIGSDIYIIARNSNPPCIEAYDVDLSASKLTKLNPAEGTCYSFESVRFKDDIYIIGGVTDLKALNSVQKYSTKANEWSRMKDMLEGRNNTSAIVFNEKIYLVGGSIDWISSSGLATVECYDPATNQWAYVASLNVARWSHRCCIINNAIHVVGGRCEGKFITSIERYNAEIDKWTIISTELNIRRSDFGIYALNGWFYAFGGDKAGGSSSRVQKINVHNGQSTELAPMPMKLRHIRCVSIDKYNRN